MTQTNPTVIYVYAEDFRRGTEKINLANLLEVNYEAILKAELVIYVDETLTPTILKSRHTRSQYK